MNYTINNYRSKKIGGKYFLTTDHGSYCVLDKEEFRKLKEDNIDMGLRKKLSERQILLNEDNVGEAKRLLKNKYDFLFSGTSLHIVVVTLRCNMNCVYCHASSKPKDAKDYDMNKETVRKTVDFIFQSPNPNITIEFQGGEPLLNWDAVKEVVEYAEEKNRESKKNLMMTVVTNMTKMDEEKMNYLIDHKLAICTSLDGPKEIHDYNRKFMGGSNYDQVIYWVKRINGEYEKRGIDNRKVNALVTLTKKSLNCPQEIVDEYVKLGLNTIHLRFLNNLGVAKDAWNLLNYSVEEYLDFWKKAADHIKNLQEKGVKIEERMKKIMEKKIEEEFDPGYLDLMSPCGAAIGQLAYNYNGDIFTCDEARMFGKDDIFLLGNVSEDEYKDIVTCNKACAVLNASMNDQYMCDNCVYKPYCGICPVCNYSEQGNLIGKISQTDRCKIFMAQFDWVVKEKFIN